MSFPTAVRPPTGGEKELRLLCYCENCGPDPEADRMRNDDSNRVYKIIFHNQGEIFEIYARRVDQGHLYGFVEVEEILFGERSQVVVDPAEERMKSEFRGVKRLFLPMHAIVRIDEVEKQGAPRVTKQEGNVTEFPSPIYAPRPPRGDSNES